MSRERKIQHTGFALIVKDDQNVGLSIFQLFFVSTSRKERGIKVI
jgi:hypothetical protein